MQSHEHVLRIPALAGLLLLACCGEGEPRPASPPTAATRDEGTTADANIRAGTGGAPSAPASETAAPPPLAPEEPGARYDVAGVVWLDGTPPERREIALGGLPGCHREGTLLTEQYIVNGGRFQNVFVRLKKAPPGVAIPRAPSEPVVLDQQGCQYVPHVLGLRVGQKLLVRNSDPTNHNVKIDPRQARNADEHTFNKIQIPGGAPFEFAFPQAEVLVPFGCTIHPHMNAHVGVVDHPFWAITGADGAFALEDVPPGAHEVEAVHEQLGRLTAKVQVGKDLPNAVEFRFKKK